MTVPTSTLSRFNLPVFKTFSYDYWWVSQGKVTVDSIDDKEDMQFADEAYDILGFTKEEKYNVYKLTSVVMHMGNLTKDFVPVGKEEQAEVKEEANARIIADICGVDPEWMITYFCKVLVYLSNYQSLTNVFTNLLYYIQIFNQTPISARRFASTHALTRFISSLNLDLLLHYICWLAKFTHSLCL